MNRPPAGVIGIAVFFAFGAIMASLATLTLLMPASTLQNIWRLNPQAREGLLRMGPWGIGLMGVEHRVSSTLRFPLFIMDCTHAPVSVIVCTTPDRDSLRLTLRGLEQQGCSRAEYIVVISRAREDFLRPA